MKKKEAKTLVLILTFLMFVSVIFPPIPECASLASVLTSATVAEAAMTEADETETAETLSEEETAQENTQPEEISAPENSIPTDEVPADDIPETVGEESAEFSRDTTEIVSDSKENGSDAC
jgi:hypothetical protein